MRQVRWLLPVGATLLSALLLGAWGAPVALPAPIPVVAPLAWCAPPLRSLAAADAAPAEACDLAQADVADVVADVARTIAGRRVLYDSEPLSDCSGMVHRVLARLDERCADIRRPELTQARSAQALADWYDRQALLIPVAATADADRWLVPGAILFFGRPGSQGLQDVVHTGFVVDVERDEAGHVVDYGIFQARHAGVVAGVSHWADRRSSPALGNADEPLVGIAFPSPQVARTAPALGGQEGPALVDDAALDDAALDDAALDEGAL